jgi:simple sugar transport system ATP-binding protein
MTYAIETFEICKYFDDFKANDKISIKIEVGTVHSICGENGAGKSTLMNVLYGLYMPTNGSIKVLGVPVKFRTSLDAIKKGIGMVHQHFMLIQNLTVAENIVLGKETGNIFKLDRKQAIKEVESLMERYKLKVDPRARIDEISLSMQQRVEILKALYRGVEILILDEPTAVLAPQEIIELFGSIRFLISQGKTIILISHKLKEVLEISDKISVLRLGKLIGTIDRSEATKEMITHMMIGREIQLGGSERTVIRDPKPALEVKALSFIKNNLPIIHDLNLIVHTGEIVGIAGIDGNGQSEFAQIISGVLRQTYGEIYINGINVSKKSVREIRQCGMGFIPEDRHRDGLVLDFPISYNMVLGTHYKAPFSQHQFIKYPIIEEFTKHNVKTYDIRLQGIHDPANSLSGGNQQKIILAREMSSQPQLIIASQPTRGLDIGAIEYTHNALVETRNNNRGVLLISYELDELMTLSDRICIMYNGKIVGEQKKGAYDIKEIGEMMLGLKFDSV